MKKYLIMFITVFLTTARSAEIKTLDGEVYKEASVTKSDDIGITIMHSDGVTRVPYANLPEEIRKKYPYVPSKEEMEEAAEREAMEKAESEARMRWEEKEAKEKEIRAGQEEDIRLGRKIVANVFWIRGDVVSVTKEGLIIRNASISRPFRLTVSTSGSVNELMTTNRQEMGELIKAGREVDDPGDNTFFVHGLGGFVDGDTIRTMGFRMPDYQYTSVLGGLNTVRAFTPFFEQTKQQQQ